MMIKGLITQEQHDTITRNGYYVSWYGEDETWNNGITTRKPWLILTKQRGPALDRRCYSWDDCLMVMVEDKMGTLVTDEDDAFNEDN